MSKRSARLADLIDGCLCGPECGCSRSAGCGPGAAAREIARRIGDGHVLAIDRSPRAIAQARAACAAEIRGGRLSVRCAAIEDFDSV